MNNPVNQSSLPSYIANASPNPPDKRAPWFANTAPTYAGIFLWFIFWQNATVSSNLGSIFSQGYVVPLIALVVSALICHFLFYLVPGMLGMRTGLPLYIVGTSTFGATGARRHDVAGLAGPGRCHAQRQQHQGRHGQE